MQMPQKTKFQELGWGAWKRDLLAVATIQNHISSAEAKRILWKPGNRFSQPQAQQCVCWGTAAPAPPAAAHPEHRMVLGKTQQRKDLHLGIQLCVEKEHEKRVKIGRAHV